MRAAAIICEFNPLHNGHRYILSKMRENAETVVCIMSGNFTQRSEAAIYDKYDRARCALAVGADLVVSLPFPWSSASGEFFSAAGVAIAEGLSCDGLYFGVNSDFEELKPTAEFMRTAEFAEEMRDASRSDEYKSAGARTVLEGLLKKHGLKPPQGENDVLALEYFRAAKNISLHPISRLGRSEEVLSASELRDIISRGELETARVAMPPAVFDICKDIAPTDLRSLAELERIYFRINARSVAFGTEAAGGGVGERIASAARASSSGAEMLELASSKKYTDSRLRRAALFAVTGVELGTVSEMPSFTELLAANDNGVRFLASNKKNRKLSVLTKAADHAKLPADAARQYAMTLCSDELYTTVRGIPRVGYYMTRSPIIIK